MRIFTILKGFSWMEGRSYVFRQSCTDAIGYRGLHYKIVVGFRIIKTL